MKEELDAKQWIRLPAVHCVAMQSSLSFMCGLDGRTKKVKYEQKISETHPIPVNIMLPSYVTPNHIVLPPLPDEDLFTDCVSEESPSMES